MFINTEYFFLLWSIFVFVSFAFAPFHLIDWILNHVFNILKISASSQHHVSGRKSSLHWISCFISLQPADCKNKTFRFEQQRERERKTSRWVDANCSVWQVARRSKKNRRQKTSRCFREKNTFLWVMQSTFAVVLISVLLMDLLLPISLFTR